MEIKGRDLRAGDTLHSPHGYDETPGKVTEVADRVNGAGGLVIRYRVEGIDAPFFMGADATVTVTRDQDGHHYVATDDGATLDVHHSHLGGQYVATCERCGVVIALWDDEDELKAHACERTEGGA